MNTDVAERLSDLAQRLKEAGPLESPALAREINEQVDSLLVPQEGWLHSVEALKAVAHDPRIAEELAELANIARHMRWDQQQLQEVVTQARYLQESGALAQILRYQRLLADVADTIRKLTKS